MCATGQQTAPSRLAPLPCAAPSPKLFSATRRKLSSVAFLLRRQERPTLLALDLSGHPLAQSIDIRPHDLETYDELARTPDNTDDPEQ